MRSRTVFSVFVCLVLVGSGLAAEYQWTGAIDNSWGNPDNWIPAGVPTITDEVRVNNVEHCIVDAPGAVAANIAMSTGSEGRLTVAPEGELTYGGNPGEGWMAIAWSGGGSKTLEVLGTMNCNNRPLIGWFGEGVLIIDGDGVMNVLGAHMELGWNVGSKGTVEMRGGTLNLNNVPLWIDRFGRSDGASIDLSGGKIVRTLPLSAVDIPPLADRIADGSVMAYGGDGQVVVDTNEATGLQIIKGLHPLNPVPEDGAFLTPGTATLSWTVPDGALVNVLFDTSDNLSTAERLVEKQAKTSVQVQVDPKTRYYWAVDVDANADGEITDDEWGPVFSFKVDNKPPVVMAADDVTTWIDNGSVDVNVSAVIIDDESTTVEWTILSQPDIGNLMEDASFESLSAGDLAAPWITHSGNNNGLTVTIEEGFANTGTKSALITYPADGSGWIDLNQTLMLQPGTQYTISAMVEWANPRAGESVNVNIYAYNWETKKWQGKGFPISEGGYTQISHQIMGEGSDAATTKIYVQLHNQADVKLRVDDFKVMAGDGSGAAAVIADPTKLDTTVTLGAVGTYVLQLEADDGEYSGSDTMTINVYEDSCEAAKSLSGFQLIPGDLNEDCVVDELDQAIMLDNWLKCNALDCGDEI